MTFIIILYFIFLFGRMLGHSRDLPCGFNIDGRSRRGSPDIDKDVMNKSKDFHPKMNLTQDCDHEQFSSLK